MAKRTKNTAALEEKVVAFAGQLGRIVGAVQARTEGWLDPQALRNQMASVRDGAAGVLEHLAGAAKQERVAQHGRDARRASANATARGRSGRTMDAPGKRHRKPMPNVVGANTSGASAKLKAAKQTRLRARG